MPKLTPLENYKRALNGETPEYVPSMMDSGVMFGVPMSTDESLGLMIGGWPQGEVRYDIFGVPYVTEANIGLGALPQPGVFILDDITKWRDVIKRPAVIDEIDWDYCASVDIPKIDRETMLFQGGPAIGNGYFEMLASFMGFDNGLIACMEEPEEVKDLMNFLCDMNVEITKKFLYHYKPEGWFMADDIAHDRAPFISVDLFLDIFEPVWRRSAAPVAEAGLHASHHNCGQRPGLLAGDHRGGDPRLHQAAAGHAGAAWQLRLRRLRDEHAGPGGEHEALRLDPGRVREAALQLLQLRPWG